jgi:hypothetical protein
MERCNSSDSSADAHSYYWRSPGAARLIAANILGDYTAIDSATIDKE